MLRAGYKNRYGKPDAIRLAKELGTNRSLVYKWLGTGQIRIERITHPPHLKKLPELLGTPVDYFAVPDYQTTSRLEAVERGLNRLGPSLEELGQRVSVLERQARPRRRRGDSTA
jgi:hypothetical protein